MSRRSLIVLLIPVSVLGVVTAAVGYFYPIVIVMWLYLIPLTFLGVLVTWSGLLWLMENRAQKKKSRVASLHAPEPQN